ncbi:MAG TPA: TIGR04255 family protein [Chlamydiales bacterium]|nr:TIGR04255 family protein [Chlamydiales bacterium]
MPIFKPEKIKKTETPLLLHPPVIEVIFELRWEIETDSQTGRMRDPSYPMMYGRIYERLKKDFPHIEDLPSVQAHPEATPFIPRHRMRKEKNGYPLVQVGPGIITVNDAKGYSWKSFRALALRLIEAVSELFPEGGMPLNFTRSELRYVNGIRFDIARENPLAFLAEKLHMKVELDPELFAQNAIHERPNALGVNLAYALEKPMGNLSIHANLGQFEGKPAFIQQTSILSVGDLVPTELETFTPWLEEAHQVAENCFQTFCKGALMEKFSGA